MSQMVRSTLFTALLAFALMPISARAASDTDGDGFPDQIETLFGSDPSLKGSTPTGSPAVVKTFDAGVLVALSFTGNDAVVVFLTSKTKIDSMTLANKSAAFIVGGLARSVTFDATGMVGQNANADTFATVTQNPDGSTDISISCSGDLASNFTDEGLVPNAATQKPVTIDAVLFLSDILYSNPSLKGFYTYDATNSTPGFATFNLNDTDAGFDITLSNVSVSPSPAAVNQAVTVSLDLKAKKIKLDDIGGSVDFGDGTQIQIDSTNIEAITHAYTVEGVYDIQISLVGTQKDIEGMTSTVSVSATAFAVVGDDAAVNANNGLVSKGTVTAADGGTLATENFAVTSLEDNTVSDASTDFTDVDGTGTQTQGEARSRETVAGLFPSRSVSKTSITVAKTTAMSTAGETRGVARKTIAVGSRQSDPTNSGNNKPPKINPGVVLVTKVSGKFIFLTDPAKNKPDSVTFTGSITLPEGFSPTGTGGTGVRFAIGLGNVVDGIQIDAKGKPIAKSTGDGNRLKKVAIKYPKLAGPATGMETAKISVTMSTQDMDLNGFESEGITNRVRGDETGRKAVDRMMQVNLLLGGEPYEAYIPVQYKLAVKDGTGTAGTMVTRRANAK